MRSYHFKIQALIIALLFSLPPSHLLAETRTATGSLDSINYSDNVLSILERSLTDHQASVQSIEGNAEILRSDEDEWIELRRGEVVYEGDQIRTGDDAYVELSYDDYHLNYARIEDNTTVELTALEPTRIHIDKGSIFSTLDGLVEGAEYEISTPTSVASVRGTSFVRSFDPDTQSEETSVVEGVVDVAPSLEDGKSAAKKIYQVTKENSLRFNAKNIRDNQLNKIKPQKFTQERKAKLMKSHQRAMKRRVEFAGGKARANSLNGQFKQLRQNPQRVQHLKQRMQQHQNMRQQALKQGHKRHEMQRNNSLGKNRVQQNKMIQRNKQARKDHIQKNIGNNQNMRRNRIENNKQQMNGPRNLRERNQNKMRNQQRNNPNVMNRVRNQKNSQMNRGNAPKRNQMIQNNQRKNQMQRNQPRKNNQAKARRQNSPKAPGKR